MTTARVNGTELFHTVHGAGFPMLVMHGGLGWDHTYLRSGLDALGERLELIYYDHRGNGRSARPERWDEVSHSTWVEDAEALRRHLGHGRILLFGHSYGGFIAQEYALRYPDRVAALILCSTAPVVDFADVMVANAQARGTPQQVQAVLESFSAPVPDDAAFATTSSTVLPLYYHQPERNLDPELFRQTRFSAEAFNHAFGRCLPEFNTLDRLGQLNIPTLVLAGRHDWVMPPAPGAERIHAALPGSELVIFEESGHFPWAEEPQRFISVLTHWVECLA